MRRDKGAALVDAVVAIMQRLYTCRVSEQKKMRLKLISCEVFARELSYSAAVSPHVVDIEFTEKAAHDRSAFLRDLIQSKIDAAEDGDVKYDAIILGFGLCGNSTAGVRTRRLPLVVPRAHDCCTLFLGSKEAFREHFSENPSTPFSSAGYLERGDGDDYLRESTMSDTLGLNRTYEEYVEMYGEENAEFIMATLNPPELEEKNNRVVFIDVPQLSHLGYAEQCRRLAEAEGKEFVLIRGDIRLFLKLTAGEWDDEDFLVLEPGEPIEPCYDWDRIIRAGERNG